MSDGTLGLDNKFIVRLWDWYDGWIDITGPISREAAEARWNEETNNGTVKATDRDVRTGYYSIFPANTRMIYTPESQGR